MRCWDCSRRPVHNLARRFCPVEAFTTQMEWRIVGRQQFAIALRSAPAALLTNCRVDEWLYQALCGGWHAEDGSGGQYLLCLESSDVSAVSADLQALGFQSGINPGRMIRVVHTVVRSFATIVRVRDGRRRKYNAAMIGSRSGTLIPMTRSIALHCRRRCFGVTSTREHLPRWLAKCPGADGVSRHLPSAPDFHKPVCTLTSPAALRRKQTRRRLRPSTTSSSRCTGIRSARRWMCRWPPLHAQSLRSTAGPLASHSSSSMCATLLCPGPVPLSAAVCIRSELCAHMVRLLAPASPVSADTREQHGYLRSRPLVWPH